MKNAIVTGANGFLGSYLVQELLDNGVEVYAIVRENSSAPKRLNSHKNLHIIACNLEEIQDLPIRIGKKGFDAFYHFAWTGCAGVARADYELQLNNVKYTCESVKVAKNLECARFVYAGSIIEYECVEYLYQDGSAPGLGNIYSTAKQSAGLMAKTIAADIKIEFMSVIISNIYGVGEFSARFIISSLNKMLKKERIPCTSGEQLYDFIYVTDAAHAFYLVGSKGKNLSSYYIGSMQPKKLKDFICEMRDIAEPTVELGFGEIPFNGISLSYKEFDTQKLHNELGFSPKVSFREGIRKTYNWLKSQGVSGSNVITQPTYKKSDFACEKVSLEGACVITPFYREDERGAFLKSYEKNIFSSYAINGELAEEFCTYSSNGVIRGLHFQSYKPQAKIVCLLSGEIMDVVVDLRPDSKTFGKWEKFVLSDKDHKILYVPKGFAHGYIVTSAQAVVSYKCIGEFRSEYDGGIRWDDPTLNIDWSLSEIKHVTVSEKDKKLPYISEVNWQEIFPKNVL